MKRFSVLAFSILIALAATSCAKPPEASIKQAVDGLEAAETAGAQKYAPEAWIRAKRAVDDLNAELAAQNKRFVLFRNFKRVRTLAEEAMTAVSQAIVEADKKTAQLRGDAAKMITDLRDSLQSARTQLSRLPRAAAVDAAKLRSSVEAAGRLLDQAQTDLDAGQFDAAMAGAGKARENIMSVLRAIEQATGRPAAKKR